MRFIDTQQHYLISKNPTLQNPKILLPPKNCRESDSLEVRPPLSDCVFSRVSHNVRRRLRPVRRQAIVVSRAAPQRLYAVQRDYCRQLRMLPARSVTLVVVGCLVAWLLGCLVAWLLGCLVAWLLACFRNFHTIQPFKRARVRAQTLNPKP
jgi:hypothetical protein